MRIIIAPMAGVSDYSFRQILKQFKPDLMYTEMVSSELFNQNNSNTINQIMKISEDETTGVQLFGSDFTQLYNNFIKLHELNYGNLLLNLGCPQKKILKSGSGANLLEKYEQVDELLSELNKKNIKVSLKIRLSEYDEKFFDIANKNKVPFLAIHARRKEDKFDNINYDRLKELSNIKRNFDLIANGNIFSLEDYNKIKKYNIDGIMLARGVIKRPQLIQEIRENRIINFNKDEIIGLLLKHLNYIRENKGDIKACMEINKFIEARIDGDITEVLREMDVYKKIEMLKNTGDLWKKQIK